MIVTIRDIEILLFILVVFYGLRKYFNGLEKTRELAMLTLQLGTKIDRTVVDMLDEYLEEIFNDYVTQHPKYISAEYISEDMSNTMRDELVEMVSSRMSPYIYQQLAIYYNESSLTDIIANKMMQMLAMFMADKNSIRPDNK